MSVRRLSSRLLRGPRRGAIVIVVALVITILIGAGALVVDVGYQRLVASQLQSSLDAAAMAGAAHLADGGGTVRTAARTLASRNQVGTSSLAITNAEIEIGTWSTSTDTFTALSSGQESTGTAVRVTHTVSGIPTFLGKVFGVQTLAVTRSSIAGTAGSAYSACGVLADTTATVQGTWSFDSYDSTAGTYSLARRTTDSSICSNGSLSANGTPNVYGNFRYGPSGTVSVGSNVLLTGDTQRLPARITLPSASSTYAKTHNNNTTIGRTSSNKNPLSGTNFSMSSQDTLTLNAGTYYFTSFQLNGQAALKTNGNVTIYVNGDFKANGGGIVNLTQNPAKLTVYVDGSRTVTVNGTADFYGSVIAPSSAATINGTAAYYGILIARTASLSGTGRMHADTSLISSMIGSSGGNQRVVLRQ